MGRELLFLETIPTLLLAGVTFFDAFKDKKIMEALIRLLSKNSKRGKHERRD